MIHVIATIELHPGKRNAFIEAFTRILPRVRAEQGCIEYGAAVDLDTGLERQAPIRDDVIAIIEKWKSLETLEAHLNSDHMVDYRVQVKDLIASATLHILEPAG